MALKSYYSRLNDFDSDYFDISSVFNDTHEFLNVAFIGSPNESLSYLHNDSPLRNLSLLLYSNGESTQNKDESKTSALSENEDMTKPSYKNLSDLNYPGEIFQNNTPTEADSKPYGTIKHSSLTNETGNDDTGDFHSLPKWKYNQQCLRKMSTSSCQNPEMESFAEISSIGDDSESKCGTRPVGVEKKIFVKDSKTPYLPKLIPEMTETPSCDNVPEEHKVHTEFDYSNLIRRYFIPETECDPQEFESKCFKRYPQCDYVYHELSTIQEMNSMSTDEICESLTNSSACDDSDVEDSDSKAIPEIFEPSISEESFLKRKCPPFPLNVLKIIENKHVEKHLQDRGILEESDLTLISNEFSDASNKYLEKSVESNAFHSICKRKSSYNMDSPSLISFLQHEISCMED